MCRSNQKQRVAPDEGEGTMKGNNGLCKSRHTATAMRLVWFVTGWLREEIWGLELLGEKVDIFQDNLLHNSETGINRRPSAMHDGVGASTFLTTVSIGRSVTSV
jgi:hypothetical protein